MTDTPNGVSVALTAPQARELTDTINGKLGDAWELLTRAYVERAWHALGYESWHAYCRAEFNGTRLRLPTGERRAAVASMREAGLSLRAISSATGNGVNTIRADVDELSQTDTPAVVDGTVTGIDGKPYPARKSSTPGAEPTDSDSRDGGELEPSAEAREIITQIGGSLRELSALYDEECDDGETVDVMRDGLAAVRDAAVSMLAEIDGGAGESSADGPGV